MLKLFAILAIAAVASANVVPNTCEVNKCSDKGMTAKLPPCLFRKL